ncbi:MAG TPA: GGDEF domain-containing protein, partial [Sulfuricurvum sp.]|nr:GGDEF domain-containing protein [Sulfuricurvum sp.]
FYFRMLLGNLVLLFIFGVIYYLERHARQFKVLATYDTLTGIFNRREFDRIVAEEFERSSRYNRPMSVILMDIDHFTLVTDTYGHQAGDVALKGLAKFIQGHIRRHDFFARWGGEEFAILATETTAAEAAQLAEKLRIQLQQQRFGSVGQITVSFGVAQIDESVETFGALFKQVDEALYQAKEAGRNRVQVYGVSL